MKFRHTQRRYYEEEENNDLPFNYQSQRQTSATTPAIEHYYQKIKSEQTVTQVSLSLLDRISIGVIVVLMIFWSLVILSLPLAMNDPTLFLGVLIGLIAYWAITWIAYYVGWKFYWMVLAIGWMLATGYALTVFSLVQRLLVQLLSG